MRVCIDIQAGITQRAGVGRYTKMLAEHLGASAAGDDLCLFYFDFKRKGIPFPVANASHQVARWVPGRVVQRVWRTIRWPPFDWFAGKADVYHFPNFVLPPLRKGKTVVTIHDASFVRFPNFAEQRNRRYLQARIRDTVDRADAIITDARCGAEEVQGLFGAKPEKVFPIYPGIPETMARPDPESVAGVRRKLALSKPDLHFFGTREPRNNIAFLVEIFEHLRGFDGELVIAGMPGWNYEPILERLRTSPRTADIRYIRYVDDNDLPALYAGAELFLFPSLYEGFGFPPLEAMACGTPVISSTGGSLPEVLGKGAVLIPKFDADHWAEMALAVMSGVDLRRSLVAEGRQQASKYTWSDTAQRTWQVYRKVAQ